MDTDSRACGRLLVRTHLHSSDSISRVILMFLPDEGVIEGCILTQCRYYRKDGTDIYRGYMVECLSVLHADRECLHWVMFEDFAYSLL
jgi:hypothetical protein